MVKTHTSHLSQLRDKREIEVSLVNSLKRQRKERSISNNLISMHNLQAFAFIIHCTTGFTFTYRISNETVQCSVLVLIILYHLVGYFSRNGEGFNKLIGLVMIRARISRPYKKLTIILLSR